MSSAKDIMAKAKARMWVDHPVHGCLVTSLLKLRWTDEVETAAVNAMGELKVNPAFVESLSVDEVIFLLAHEAEHVFRLHPVRMKQYAQKQDDAQKALRRYNYAADGIINDALTHAGVGTMPEGGVTIPGARVCSVEELLAKIDDAPDDFDSDMDSGSSGDGAEGMKTLEAIAREMEVKAKQAAAMAVQAAKMRGVSSGHIGEYAAKLLEVKTPWYEVLERFMTERAAADYSWKRPNRRFASSDVILPTLDSQNAMGKVAVAIDTSLSISHKELDEFASHTKRIIEQCNPSSVELLYFDTRVLACNVFNSPGEIEFDKMPKGCGTSYREVMRWYEKDTPPAAMVVFTDGYGDQGTLSDPGFPVVWATTTSTEGFTFGEVIKVD